MLSVDTVKFMYRTQLGQYFVGDTNKLLSSGALANMKGSIDLIITSPPFPLNNKKKYGNLQGTAYLEWFQNLAPVFSGFLSERGSIVIEIGNAWESGRPVQSLLPLESLMAFVKNEAAELNLIQEFICYNPSRLPSPAEWVTKHRIRTVDSYTHVWWMSKTDYPKADNAKVLRPYSKSMQKLLAKKRFNAGKRPSGHTISEKAFLKDHGGSIAHNFIEMEEVEEGYKARLPYIIKDFAEIPANKLPHNILRLSNTNSNDFFSRELRKRKLVKHPATMHPGLAAFFIEFLTDEGDHILDPFAGSNTTGYCAERMNRKWTAIEISEEYAKQSLIRFEDPVLDSTIEIIA